MNIIPSAGSTEAADRGWGLWQDEEEEMLGNTELLQTSTRQTNVHLGDVWRVSASAGEPWRARRDNI